MSKPSKLTLNRETLTRLSMTAVRRVPGGYDDTGSDMCSAQQCSQIACPPSYNFSECCVTTDPPTVTLERPTCKDCPDLY
jgi:hypothetical protein